MRKNVFWGSLYVSCLLHAIYSRKRVSLEIQFSAYRITVCLPTDLDKLDNEKKDLIQSDISALHHFYSKHLEFPDHESLVVLFAQVRGTASGDTASLPLPKPCPQHTPSGKKKVAFPPRQKCTLVGLPSGDRVDMGPYFH